MELRDWLKVDMKAGKPLFDQLRTQVIDGISKIAAPERVIFTDVLPKTPSGKIMRRLLKEIIATGDVESDVTALVDSTAVEKLKVLVKAAR